MIELGYLEVKNFLSVGNKKEKFPFEKKSIVALIGKIGSGKTLYLDALSVALFGKTYSGKPISSIVNWKNGKKCEVKMTFKKNKNEYVIFRSYKPDKEYLLKDGKEIDFSGKKHFNEIVENILNIDRKIFDQTVFLSDKNFTPFMELKSVKKADFLKRIFDFHKYDDMKDVVNAEKRTLIKELDVLTGKSEAVSEMIEEMEEDQRKKKEKKEAELLDLKGEIKEVGVLVSKKEKMLSEEGYDVDFVNSKVDEREKKREKFDDAQNRMSEKKDCVYSVKKKYDDILSDIEKAENGISRKSVHEEKIDELKENEVIREEFSKNYEDELTEKKEKFESEISEIDLEVEKKKNIVSDIDSEISVIKNVVSDKQVTVSFYDKNDVCDRCQSKLTPDFKKKIVSPIQEKIDDSQKKMKKKKKKQGNLNEKIDELNEEKNDLKELIKEIDENLSNYRDKMNERKSIFEKIEMFEKEISELNSYYGNVTDEKIDKMKSELKDVKKEGTKKKEEYQKNKQVVEKLKDEISNITDVIDKENEKKDDYEVAKKEVESLKKRLDRLSDKRKVVVEDVKNIDNSSVKKKEKEFDKIKEEMKEKKYLVDIHEKLVYVVDKGIKKFIIRKYIGMLNGILQKYLNFFDSEFDASFDATKKLECKIYSRGNERDYYSLSNGQSKIVNLSILFTFVEFLKRKSGTQFPLIFLDELLGNSLSVEALRTCMDAVKNIIPYVVMITHRSSNVEIADKVIKVSRKKGFSNYEVEEGGE